MSRPISNRKSSVDLRQRRSGFALIIVVSLLALLVMVLVSLATITRIEAGVGTNSRRHATAKQNARFALDVAMAELQRHAGPDNRVTAVSNLEFGSAPNGARFWTGVRDSGNSVGPSTWLVSGNENGALNFDPLSPIPNPVELVDLKSVSGATSRVIVNRVDLISSAYPGLSGPQTVGRYAWWVGDEGVKASMALVDRWNQVDYGPFTSADLNGDGVEDGLDDRQRLRQQVPLAHQHFRGLLTPAEDAADPGPPAPDFGWDPAVQANRDIADRILHRLQLRFMDPENFVGLTSLHKARFHDWTTVSSGVLASTNAAYPGLRRDLSRAPGLLGDAFTRWADYAEPTNMEQIGGPSTAVPAILDAADARRVYAVQQRLIDPPTANSLVRQVAPVLTSCLIHFTVSREPADPVTLRSRIRVTARVQSSAWNPYTSALIPPQMQVSIIGLPTVTLRATDAGSTEEVAINLAELFAQGPAFGDPFTVQMGFQADRTNASDFAAWLPGRVHNWRTPSTGSFAGLPVNGLLFYGLRLSDSTGLDATAWSRLWTDPLGVTDSRLPSAGTLEVLGPATQLTYRFWANGNIVSETVGPMMSSAYDTGGGLGERSFALGFRLRQPNEHPDWLEQYDPRSASLAAGATMAFDPSAGGGGLSPSDYGSGWAGYSNGVLGSLLARDTQQNAQTMSSNNDTPVFELPRQPVLSLAALQHMQIAGTRPFAIGNSWGAALVPTSGVGGTVGSWFDRFFFSGLTDANPGGVAGVLPMFHLRPFSGTGTPVMWADLHDPGAQGAYTSRHLLVDGAFNVNSTSSQAWVAVLRSMRPFASNVVTTADLADGTPYAVTGTVGASGDVGFPVISDQTQGTAGTLAGSPSGFLRFSQSFQETYMTTGNAGGFDRTRYRVGFRGGTTGATTTDLSADDFDRLAGEIVNRVRQVGPIRTLEQFVSPVFPVGAPTQSILEAAIADAGLNASVAESCTQRLSQADILTAIGPFLQCRSDTFVIRTYGETVNPLLAVTHPDYVVSRAWCEATVQRIPTPVDPTDSIIQPTGPFGRRFVITSFRWLSPDDI